jgi:hypothetical protein
MRSREPEAAFRAPVAYRGLDSAPHLGLAANPVRHKTIQPTFTTPLQQQTTFISNKAFLVGILTLISSTRLPSVATPTPAGTLLLSVSPFYLACFAILSATMDFSQAKLTAEQMKEWDEDKLLTWIQQELSRPLKDDTIKKFKDAEISGRAFLKLANSEDFFNQKFGLSIGLSLELASLASEAVVMVQKGKEQDTSAGKSTDHSPLLFSSH